MTLHYPPHIKPLPNETVLLISYGHDADDEPLCESGYIDEDGRYWWHNTMHNVNEEPVHAWMPLPLIPERP